MNFYIAAPFDTEEKRANAIKVKEILSRDKNNSVFCPWEYKVPQAWEYPNSEWGLMVFMNDIKAIDSCDIVIMLSYGRNEYCHNMAKEIVEKFPIYFYMGQ